MDLDRDSLRLQIIDLQFEARRNAKEAHDKAIVALEKLDAIAYRPLEAETRTHWFYAERLADILQSHNS